MADTLSKRWSRIWGLEANSDDTLADDITALIAAAEALRNAHLAHIRANGRIPELQDARNCAFESLLALLPEEPHD